MAATWIKSLCKKSSKPKAERKISISHQGNHYNLSEIYGLINQQYFEGKLDLSITWSSSSIRGARRCRRLGCFVPTKKLIRISKILDDVEIPYYFICFIVYHEMLHSLYPPRKTRGKTEIHHSEFRSYERNFSDYEKVKEWEKEVGKKKFFLEESHGRT